MATGGAPTTGAYRWRDRRLPPHTQVLICPTEAAGASGAVGLLLPLLSREFSAPVDDIVWHRPSVATVRTGPDRLFTSISRTDGCVAVAVSRRRIGIDIEATQTQEQSRDLLSLFHPRDQAAANRVGGAARRRRVTTIWTRIEAVLKLRGTGLRVDPGTVRVGPGPGALRGRRIRTVSAVAALSATAEYSVSLAWERSRRASHSS
ncbi:4'-phosphopantetheinyl transferase superfamily protein [Brevibacterium sp. 'Marine']|uniref:4'-phosphopantetheinyl transferase family protein n=1 Tax=Brevibacterium sp. 'Marine' TaxID=2725563 RepID=UPI00145C88ED|nr:4'-phosphopantetheinyl transferase superfamily protein [Brevibacterium sp. 'Marine']